MPHGSFNSINMGLFFNARQPKNNNKKQYLVTLLLLFWGISFSTNAQTVYITKTGKKYHISTCRYLSKSKLATELKSAIDCHYTPCKVCHPPTVITVPKSMRQASTPPKTSSPAKSRLTPQPDCSKTKAGKKSQSQPTNDHPSGSPPDN